MKTARKKRPATQAAVMTDPDYQRLANFRFMLRQFLEFSARAARACGLTPPQHQALLVIRALSISGTATIAETARWLMSRHHSTVELADRLCEQKLVRRRVDAADRRRVTLVLTPKAERILEQLSATHLEELRRVGQALQGMLKMLRKPSPSG
jgi:DNA-binding MarR family transcriptional regulator